MSLSIAERYIHYDVTEAKKWQIVQPSDFGVRALNLSEYQAYISERRQYTDTRELDISPEEEVLIAEAKSFVEQAIGLEVTSGVSKFEALDKGRAGFYDPITHHVAFKKETLGTGYGDVLAFGSVLVHEFVHSTANDMGKVIDLHDGDKHKIRTVLPHSSAEITPAYSREYFFEEGLAEEIASWWRVRFNPSLEGRARDLLDYQGGSAIPVRMFSQRIPIDIADNDTDRVVAQSAYAAYGIQILSEYTGVDLVDLLIKARKQSTHHEAKQTLRETVDSVEEGLYDVLTSAEYSLEDFEDCIKIIKQAIAKHAHGSRNQPDSYENTNRVAA